MIIIMNSKKTFKNKIDFMNYLFGKSACQPNKLFSTGRISEERVLHFRPYVSRLSEIIFHYP